MQVQLLRHQFTVQQVLTRSAVYSLLCSLCQSEKFCMCVHIVPHSFSLQRSVLQEFCSFEGAHKCKKNIFWIVLFGVTLEKQTIA